MTDLFVKIYDYLLGEKRITAIFLLVFVALCIFVSFNINYEEDIGTVYNLGVLTIVLSI